MAAKHDAAPVTHIDARGPAAFGVTETPAHERPVHASEIDKTPPVSALGVGISRNGRGEHASRHGVSKLAEDVKLIVRAVGDMKQRVRRES